METCLLTYYIHNKEVKSTCDFKLKIDQETIVIYEVIRVIEGKPLYVEDHINRFFKSCDLQDIKPIISSRQIINRIKTIIELNKQIIGNLKWAVLKYESGIQDFVIWASPFFYPGKELTREGVNCSFYKAKRKKPNSKTLKNKVQNEVQQFISEKKLFDLILHDHKGKITEGSRTNIFFIRNNTVFTSFDTDVLEGISRKKVIESCSSLGIELIKKDINKDEIQTFDFAFLSGTSINILPIKRIENHYFNTKNELFQELLNKYILKSETYIENFQWNL